MSDTNSPLLGLLLMAAGNDASTWGDNLNTLVFTVLENAIAANNAISTTGGTTTLLEAQRICAMQTVSGSLASNATIVVNNNVSKWWVFNNNCTLNGFVVQIETSGGTPTTIPAGLHFVYCDGNNAMFVK